MLDTFRFGISLGCYPWNNNAPCPGVKHPAYDVGSILWDPHDGIEVMHFPRS